MADIRQFPGTSPEAQEDISFEDVLKEAKDKGVTKGIVIGVFESGDFMVAGNTSIAASVYWLEVAKKVIIDEST